jgi:hypothetical protein
MWKYQITRVIPSGKAVSFLYEVYKDAEKVASDEVVLDASSIMAQPSDGREDYIKGIIAERCKPLMVISDVKADFSGLVGVEVELETVKYETKAQRVAMQAEAMKEVI